MNPLHEYFNSFHPISTATFSQLLDATKTAVYKKGAIITAEGEVQKDLLFVKKGVQMSFLDHKDKQHVNAFTYPPGLTGVPESFLYQTPSKYVLVTLTDSELWKISYLRLQQYFEQSREIERLFRKITEAMLVGMIHRHTELQSLTIEERFKVFVQRSPHLLQLVPHKYIASYLHIDATNFSKLYNSIKI
ncbi:MAG: Crp/Fnr family transcriptional regulator [Spirosomataceae bacterium]